MFIRLLVWGLVIYLIYKFVFELVIPVSKAANTMKSKINEMQQQQAFKQQSTSNKKETTSPDKRDDYIEFEEIKD
jgi:hypothetical protein